MLYSVGALEGQLIGWNEKYYEKKSQASTRFSILVKLKERARLLTFYVTSMYGAKDRTLKPHYSKTSTRCMLGVHQRHGHDGELQHDLIHERAPRL